MKLMTHVVVGYPTLDDTFDLVMTMVQSGVSAIELQIPFSDPVADGPTILQASEAALQAGVTPHDAFGLVEKLRSNGVTIPLIVMTYANIVMAQGIASFVTQSAHAGVSAFIIPDLPLDTKEGVQFLKACEQTNTEMIPLFAPTMTDDRYQFLGFHAKSMVYAVSRTGITGVEGVGDNLDEYLQKIRKVTNAEIALGFGIQSVQQVKALKGKVDYAVIGSHILRIFQKESLAGVRNFLQEVLQAC